MRLHNAAIFFDREIVYDGYTGVALFKAQVKNFNDASSTGATLRRRVLSVAPANVMPTRGCVKLENLHWIAGLRITDTFYGREIRHTYNLRVGTSLFDILSPGNACIGAAVTSPAYGYEGFFKDNQDNLTGSAYDTFWNIFFCPIEPVVVGSFLRTGSRMLRVRQAYVNPEGLRVAESDELDADWSQTAVFTDLSTYNPVTDTYTGTTISVQAIQMDSFKLYKWRVESEAQKKPGDRTVIVPLTVTPVVGATFTMVGRSWRVISAQPELDAWALHSRLV